MRYDLLSRNQFYQTQFEIFQKEYAGEGEEAIRQRAEKSTNLFFTLSNTEYERLAQEKQGVREAETGIFTASFIFNHILMWSHYSESHKGFCVELDLEKLLLNVNNPLRKCKSAIFLCRIQYDDVYPLLLPLPGLNFGTWMKQYEVKARKWGYEAECRLIGLGATDFPALLDQGVVTKVILGCQMPDSDQEEIIHELLKLGGGIPLERAVKSKDKFALEFVPVDY